MESVAAIYLYFLLCPVGVAQSECHINTPGVESIEMASDESMGMKEFTSHGMCMHAAMRQIGHWSEKGYITVYDDAKGYNEEVKFAFTLPKIVCRPKTDIGTDMPGNVG